MQAKQMIIKSVRTRCQVTMCSNIGSNQISRTSGPGSAAVCICDECLLEAVKLRFGDVIVGDDAAIMRINEDSHMRHIGDLNRISKAQEEKIDQLQKTVDSYQKTITLLESKAADGAPAPEARESSDEKPTTKKGTGKK